MSKKPIKNNDVEQGCPSVSEAEENDLRIKALANKIEELKTRGLEVFIHDGSKGLPIQPSLDSNSIPRPRISIHPSDSFSKISVLVQQAEKKVDEYEEKVRNFLQPSANTKKLIKILKEREK